MFTIIDTAAFLLEKALETTDSKPLIEAAYWLESVYLLDESEKSISASHLLKNVALVKFDFIYFLCTKYINSYIK